MKKLTDFLSWKQENRESIETDLDQITASTSGASGVFKREIMRKALIVVLSCLLISSFAFAEWTTGGKPGTEPDGFRGIKWGTSIDDLAEMKYKETDPSYGGVQIYTKDNEDLKIREATLTVLCDLATDARFLCKEGRNFLYPQSPEESLSQQALFLHSKRVREMEALLLSFRLSLLIITLF